MKDFEKDFHAVSSQFADCKRENELLKSQLDPDDLMRQLAEARATIATLRRTDLPKLAVELEAAQSRIARQHMTESTRQDEMARLQGQLNELRRRISRTSGVMDILA
jgi:chromosome segregation ATPase